MDTMDTFDWKQYLVNYKDVRKYCKTKEQAYHHWIHYGKKEKRTDAKIPSVYNVLLKRTATVFEKTTTFLPMVDLRNKFPPCYNQGNLGSCTANAIVGSYQYLNPSFMGSRLFQYYNERQIEGSVSTDSGATVSDSISAVKNYGLCRESEWNYNIQLFATKPPQPCYTNALSHRVKSAFSVEQTIRSMKGHLASGYPFIVGIAVYSSFESQQVANTGIVPMPTSNDLFLGGHCVVVCGYNQLYWIVRNSWGTNWGVNGYFYLPIAYLLNPNLCSDNWCIT